MPASPWFNEVSRTKAGRPSVPGLAGSSVKVMNEDRTLPIIRGTLQDAFAAERSYDIYKIG